VIRIFTWWGIIIIIAGLAITNVQLNQSNTLLYKQIESQPAAVVPVTMQELVPKLLPSVVIINSRTDDDFSTTKLGTGFFIYPGVVVTAYHVIADRNVIEISRYNSARDYESTRYNLEYDSVSLVGYDPLIDIAILRINDANIMGAVIPWGERPSVGDVTVSIGHPLGYEYTVTKGIVSYVGRRNDIYEFNKYIQTDAPINSGNSGGPLFNDKGEVIGLMQAVVGNGGIAMAIEAELIEKTVANILESGGGEYKHASFGVGLKSLEIGKVMVTKFLKNSAASNSDMLIGDVIIALDGVQYRDILAMTDYVQTRRPGDIMIVSVIRDGTQKEIPVKLGVIKVEDAPEGFGPAAWSRLR